MKSFHARSSLLACLAQIWRDVAVIWKDGNGWQPRLAKQKAIICHSLALSQNTFAVAQASVLLTDHQGGVDHME